MKNASILKLAEFETNKPVRLQHLSDSEIANYKEVDRTLKDFFKKNPRKGLNLGSYGYYPKGASKWVATDGSLLKGLSPLDLIADYADRYLAIDIIQAVFYGKFDHHIISRRDQADHEAANL